LQATELKSISARSGTENLAEIGCTTRFATDHGSELFDSISYACSCFYRSGVGHFPSNVDFLQRPWQIVGNRVLAVGSDIPYPYTQFDKPSTKYEALFDPNPAFNDLRFAFLVTVCPEGFTDLQDIRNLDDLTEEQVEAVFDFCSEYLSSVHQAQLSADCPNNFLEKAWPVYVEMMWAVDVPFYLSCDELMLISELRRENLVIFSWSGSCAQYVGSVLGHEGSPVTLVAVKTNALRRVRSHFERLTVCDHAAAAASSRGTDPHGSRSPLSSASYRDKKRSAESQTSGNTPPSTSIEPQSLKLPAPTIQSMEEELRRCNMKVSLSAWNDVAHTAQQTFCKQFADILANFV
jgi:hypothetical protein